MNGIPSPDELTAAVGENIKALRLQKNLTQQALAARAGVSKTALRHLEAGQAALSTLVRVARALDRQDWLLSLAPRITVNPLHMARAGAARRRARPGKRAHGQAK